MSSVTALLLSYSNRSQASIAQTDTVTVTDSNTEGKGTHSGASRGSSLLNSKSTLFISLLSNSGKVI